MSTRLPSFFGVFFFGDDFQITFFSKKNKNSTHLFFFEKKDQKNKEKFTQERKMFRNKVQVMNTFDIQKRFAPAVFNTSKWTPVMRAAWDADLKTLEHHISQNGIDRQRDLGIFILAGLRWSESTESNFDRILKTLGFHKDSRVSIILLKFMEDPGDDELKSGRSIFKEHDLRLETNGIPKDLGSVVVYVRGTIYESGI